MPEVTETRLARVESKIDDLQQAVVSLARVEERLITVFNRQSNIETKVTNMQTSIEKLQNGAAGSAFIERIFWICVVGLVTYFSSKL